MARAYTAELRDRVLRACERGGLRRARANQGLKLTVAATLVFRASTPLEAAPTA